MIVLSKLHEEGVERTSSSTFLSRVLLAPTQEHCNKRTTYCLQGRQEIAQSSFAEGEAPENNFTLLSQTHHVTILDCAVVFSHSSNASVVFVFLSSGKKKKAPPPRCMCASRNYRLAMTRRLL